MDDYARQLASNKETRGNSKQGKQGQLTNHNGRYFPMGKARDAKRSQIAAALR
jgi:hypothetical protein